MTSTDPPSLRSWLVAAVVSLVGAQFLVGIVEAFQYNVSVAATYESVTTMRSTTVGQFLAGFHYWGSALLLICSLGLIIQMLFTQGYFEKRQWFGALGIAMVAFAFQITGNLLPMDRHGVQTAVVEAGISGSIPGAGHAARAAMLAGPSFSGSTLGLWWKGHEFILPIFAVIGAAMIFLRRSKLPAYLIAPILVAVLGAVIRAPLGLAATGADFGQYNAKVSWYTWPLHSMMGAFEQISPSLGWIGSVLVPSLCVIGLLTLPWTGRKLVPNVVRTFTVLVAVAFLGAGALFGGGIASLTGNRDPAVQVTANGALPTKPKATDATTLALVATGAKAFDTVGCADCHGKGGAKGDGGPDLTSEYKLHSDPAWFAKLIRNPKSVNPSATMPAFPKLSEAQVTAISTFLSQPR